MTDPTPTHYGQVESENNAMENLIARQITSEIESFGITERQRWLIINQLALGFEDVNDLREFTAFVKELKGSQIFIMEAQDGTISR